MKWDEVLETAAGKAMLEAAQREVAERLLERRKELVALLDKNAQVSKEELAAREAEEAARVRLERARAAVKEAEVEFQQAHHRAAGFGHNRQRVQGLLEKELRDTAPPVVEETLDWVKNEFDRRRHESPVCGWVATKNQWMDGTVLSVTESDGPSRLERIRYLVRARGTLAEISLLADPGEIEAKCVELRAGLPEIEVRPLEVPVRALPGEHPGRSSDHSP